MSNLHVFGSWYSNEAFCEAVSLMCTDKSGSLSLLNKFHLCMYECVHVCCVCACPWKPVKGVRNWSYRGVLAARYGAGSRTWVLWRNRDYSRPWALSLAPAWCLLPGGGTNLGGRDLRMGWTKGKSHAGANFIQRVRQFVPWRLRKTTRVRFSWVQAVRRVIHKDKLQVAKACLSLEAHE